MKGPLPRLLRLRGALAEALPSDDVKDVDASALAETYERLRRQAESLANELGVASDEFDGQFPEVAGRPVAMDGPMHTWAQRKMHNESVARTAATLLRQLAGFLGGLIEAQALVQQITADEMAAAREPARPPVGFR